MSDKRTDQNNEVKPPVDNGLPLSQAFGLAWEMGYLLALPLVALAVAGRFMDKHFQTSPLFLLLGIGASVIISSILLGRRAMGIIDKLAPDKKAGPKN